eukprot:TRINITY_DN4828_c0_g1_i1.p1 TRINITY_DN4828_c0_g1~~TRINITY_DN4828_c0_g1_i1.p1  ORF type:complete len:893 (-),score=205.72 TRINITY_DN4828_c0_g1_i1:72-2750(-)
MASQVEKRLVVLEELLLSPDEPASGSVIVRLERLENILHGGKSSAKGGLTQRLESLETITFGKEGESAPAPEEEKKPKPSKAPAPVSKAPKVPVPVPASEPTSNAAPRPLPRPKSSPLPKVAPKPAPKSSPAKAPWRKDAKESVQEFAERFELNGDALNCLRQLPEEVLKEVQQEFDPPEQTRDRSALFIRFAEGKRRRITAQTTAPQQDQEETREDTKESLEEFAERFQFNAYAVKVLQQLPEEVFEKVQQEFAPDNKTKNTSALFVKFAESKYRRMTGETTPPWREDTSTLETIEEFAQRFELNGDAVHVLQQLPEDILQKVQLEFAPPAHTKDVSTLLVKFAEAKHRRITGQSLAIYAEAEELPPLKRKRGDTSWGSLEDFVQKWNLDEEAQNCLQSLDEEVLQKVMVEFQPRPGTPDVSAKLIRFATSRQQGSLSSFTSLDEFAERWSLDQEAWNCLRSLDDDVLQKVMADFKPKAGTVDVSAKLIRFATSRQQGSHSSWSALDEFAQNWNLDQEAWNCLKCLDEETLQKVMAEFQPRAGTADVSAKLVRYVAGLFRKKASQANWSALVAAALEEFAQQWNLDQEAWNCLQSLDEEVAQKVMTEFQPKPGTTDVSAKLIRYATSMRHKHGSHANWTALDDFAQKWSLDQEAWNCLKSLDDGVLQKVMADFQPKPGTADVSAKLIRFATSRQQGTHSSWNALDEFAQKWNIDQEAWNCLKSLEDDVLQRLMAEFQPTIGTADVSAKLIRFATSLCRKKGSRSNWSSLDDFAQKWNLDEEAWNCLRRLDEEVLQQVMADFKPSAATADTSSKLIRFAMSRQGAHSKRGAMEDFAQKWSLDQEAWDCLNSLTDDVLQGVIVDFQPKPGTADVSSKLIRFATSRQHSSWQGL